MTAPALTLTEALSLRSGLQVSLRAVERDDEALHHLGLATAHARFER